jgi:hypothetical protein
MLTMLPSSVAMSDPSDTLVRMSHLRSIECLGAAIEPAVRRPAGGRCQRTLLDAADAADAAGATRYRLMTSLAVGSSRAIVIATVGGGFARLQGWAVVIPPVAVGGGLLAAIAVGATAGLYPAIRAARIPPTDALRAV